jgi:hypothetical protein
MGAPDSSDTTPDRLAPASCAFIGIAEIISATINPNAPTVTDQRLSFLVLISQASLFPDDDNCSYACGNRTDDA